MKVFNLAWANIKTNKSASVSLFILILLAALLLNIGLTVLTQIHSFYDDKVAELQDAHVSVTTRSAEHSTMYDDFFRSYKAVNNTETQTGLILEGSTFSYGQTDMTITTLLMNADDDVTVSPLKLVERLESTNDNDIYMSYSFKANNNYKLGDTFTLNYSGGDYSFRVAGFFETTMYGTISMGILKFLLPDASYKQLASKLGEHEEVLQINAVLQDGSQADELQKEFKSQFSSEVTEGGSPYWLRDTQTAKSVGTITINIVALILVAFAAVMIIVSLIVIIFRVTNSIEDGMVNIGVLKAIGYTSSQILASIVLQFMLVTLFAGIVGVALSYIALPLFGGIIASLSGLIWSQGFDPVMNLLGILFVALLVLAVTVLIALKIRRLPPVIALRGGVLTHSFKKNYFPLEKTRGGLHFLLACKTMLANLKQNVTIAIIMIAVTFASVFSVVLYYNIAVDKTSFVHLVGVETSNAVIIAKPDANTQQLREGIENEKGVSKVVLLDLANVKIDDQPFYMNITEDFSKLENNTVYEGRYPNHDNEIALSWLISKQLNKDIGDTVEVAFGQASRSYLVTGLSQSINNMGLEANLTLAGAQQLLPDYEGSLFHVYLEGVDTADYIESIKEQYADSVTEVIDLEETLESQTSVYTSVVFIVMLIILTITILVVVLILYLVIKTMIAKRKKEFGILTANGFTSFQLMNQVAMSFIPTVAIGVVIGCLLGYLYTNSLLALLLSSAGIRNVQFTVNLPLTIVLSVGIIVLAYLVSILVSRRIKRISAYELITE